MNKLPVFAIVLFSIIVSGCASITADRPYFSSTENIIKLQHKIPDKNVKVKIGTFTESRKIGDIGCRADGSIDVSQGQTKGQYIERAIKTEFFNAGIFSVDGDTEITGELRSLAVSSISPAYWEIEIFISSNKSTGYPVKTRFEFQTSWMAGIACENLANAYGPAVQQLISDIIDDSRFEALIGQ